jgi:hypothetical protein
MVFFDPEFGGERLTSFDRTPGERIGYEGEIATSEELQMAEAVRQLAGREMPPCEGARKAQS